MSDPVFGSRLWKVRTRPSRDQSPGIGNPPVGTSTSPSPESARRLRRMAAGTIPCERNAISLPSGDQTGPDSSDGSEVNRVITSLERSSIQRSEVPVAGSVFSIAAFRPSGRGAG